MKIFKWSCVKTEDFFCKARDYLHDFFPIYSVKGEEFCKNNCLI